MYKPQTSVNQNGSIRWRCTTRSCESSILTKDVAVLKHLLNHQHGASKGENIVVLLGDKTKYVDVVETSSLTF